jgi:hypothetical protein
LYSNSLVNAGWHRLLRNVGLDRYAHEVQVVRSMVSDHVVLYWRGSNGKWYKHEIHEVTRPDDEQLLAVLRVKVKLSTC